MGEADEQLRLLDAEVIRLTREIAVLDRQWERKYRLALIIVLAIPLYFLAGRFWAGIVIVMTPALVATQAYLLTVRRAEARELYAEAKHAAAAIRRGAQKKVGA